MAPPKCNSLCGWVCHRRAATFIVMVLFAGLAACRPVPSSPTPDPRLVPVAAPPGHISTLIARLTERSAGFTTVRRTATASPTASLSATPTLPLDARVLVGVPLEEAEREVLSWLDPAREPRLEWSAYVRREALRLAGWTVTYDSAVGFFFEERPIDLLSDPVIMVVVSTRGIDPILGLDEKGAPRAPGVSQTPWLSPKRVGVAALFDAFTGRRLAAMTVCPAAFEPDGCSWSMAELHSLPTASAHQAPALRITVTPLPTLASALQAASAYLPSVATPVSAHHNDPALGHLTWSTLPKDLHATFRFYGLAPGSNWTWRYVEQNGDVWWRTSIVTETVEAIWLEGDMAVVQSRVAVRKLSGPDIPEWNMAADLPEPSIQRRFVSRDHISTERGSVRNYIYEHYPSDFDALGVAKPTDFALFGYASREETITGPKTLDLPFAVFKGCWEATVWAANAATSARWICPGIGVVQYSMGVGQTFVTSAHVATLIRYHIADLPDR